MVGGNVVEVEGDVGDAGDAMIVEEQQQTQTQAQPQTQPLPDPNQILFEAKALLEQQEKHEQLRELREQQQMQYIALDDDNVQIVPAPLITQQQQQAIPQTIAIAPIQQQQPILPSTSTVQGVSGLIQSLLPQYVAQTGEGARPKQINVLVQRSQHQCASSL